MTCTGLETATDRPLQGLQGKNREPQNPDDHIHTQIECRTKAVSNGME